jgi:hypothetical protein
MPSTVISARRGLDHFEPEATLNPTEQRLLRGHLEQIDFAAYAANRELISRTLGRTDLGKFERLAVAAAQARVHWVAEAASMADCGAALSAAQVARLTILRQAYEELTEVYEAMRRMVERGYLPYQRKE